MDPAWHAKFLDNGARLFKFVKDNICDETCRTLPKTNPSQRISLAAILGPPRVENIPASSYTLHLSFFM